MNPLQLWIMISIVVFILSFLFRRDGDDEILKASGGHAGESLTRGDEDEGKRRTTVLREAR